MPNSPPFSVSWMTIFSLVYLEGPPQHPCLFWESFIVMFVAFGELKQEGAGYPLDRLNHCRLWRGTKSLLGVSEPTDLESDYPGGMSRWQEPPTCAHSNRHTPQHLAHWAYQGTSWTHFWGVSRTEPLRNTCRPRGVTFELHRQWNYCRPQQLSLKWG